MEADKKEENIKETSSEGKEASSSDLCGCLVVDPCGCYVDPCSCLSSDDSGCCETSCGCINFR